MYLSLVQSIRNIEVTSCFTASGGSGGAPAEGSGICPIDLQTNTSLSADQHQ
jgi:hypothetical protein